MPTTSITARVRSIKLLEFKYDRSFKAQEGKVLQFSVQVKHRIPNNSTRLEVLVTISYSEKDAAQAEPLVSADCLTVYNLEGEGADGEIDEETGKEVVNIPDSLMTKMFSESIAHCRALMATQTAGTTFGGTHVEIADNFASGNEAAQ